MRLIVLFPTITRTSYNAHATQQLGCRRDPKSSGNNAASTSHIRNWLARITHNESIYSKYRKQRHCTTPRSTRIKRSVPPNQTKSQYNTTDCSAYAEMLPAHQTTTTAHPRLLRIRGDAPWPEPFAETPTVTAPHTRRCSVHVQVRERGFVDCSAYAEMLPPDARPLPAQDRLLRIRGDAPATGAMVTLPVRAAPHTRR